VELRRLIPTGIAASAVGHLSVLAMVMIFAEVHPFGSVTAEPIAVDIVSAEEATPAPKPEETPPPPKADASDAFNLSSKSAPSSTPVPSPAQEAAPQPQKQAALSTARPARQAAAQPPPPQTSPPPSYAPPEPDLAIKYHVMLGLPPELPPRARPVKSGDGFDGEASQKADIASSLVAEFRRHLRTCSKLPASITTADSVMIKLRVLMTPEGRLAAEPVVAEGSASLKALDLKQSAVEALQACQPYTMLPADRYGEWKVLDLSFTPQDFG
jgi:hypothetical protein